ncbi:MAG: K(+)-transporting ATPase subunit C [Tepidisphaeraceae bacterium]
MKPINTIPEDHISAAGQLYSAFAATVVLAIICCVLYPLTVWAVAQVAFPNQSNGSLVDKAGAATTDPAQAVGSRWIGQQFTSAKYFHPRPSAAGAGYDGAASSGTNLGPLSDKLLNGIHGSKNQDGTPNPAADFDGIKDLAVAYRTTNGLAADATVPADAVTWSGSGLDPHISPANATLQIARVAKARGLAEADVRTLVEQATEQPFAGLIGEKSVNVMVLNLSLDAKTK